jgi:hypothetical protein
MSIGVRCGSCNRELLLGQLVQPSNGFRCHPPTQAISHR